MNVRAAIVAFVVYGAFAGIAARADIHFLDGFDTAVYTVGDDGMGKIHGKGGNEAGFSADKKWNSNDSSVVRCFSGGLLFPDSWSGFSVAGSGSIGYKNSGNSDDSSSGQGKGLYRAGQRELAANALPETGTFYLRLLMRQESGAGVATRVQGMLRGVGLRTCGLVITDYGRTESAAALDNGAWFAFRKTSNDSSAVDTEIVFCFGGNKQVLVEASSFSEGTNYLCVAKIQVGATGSSAQAFAMPIADFDSSPDSHWGEALETESISSSTPFTHLCMTGPHQTNNKIIQFDEIAAASDIADLVPTAAADFQVYPTVASIVPALHGFSVPVNLVLGSGRGADVVVEYGLSADSLSSSVAVLSGVAEGAHDATVSVLEPDTTYYWRLRASSSGLADAVSAVQTVHTLGVPVFGDTSATLSGSTVAFSATLASPALYGDDGRPATGISVTYTVGGSSVTRSLGELSSPGSLSLSVSDIPWGETSTYYFTASATKDERTFSATTASANVSVLYSGDIYVSNAGSATLPYDSPEKATSSLADAIAVAGAGGKVHVAAGEYTTSSRIKIDKAVRVEGATGSPRDVVVRNVGTSTTCRVFNLEHADAVLSGVTVTDGHIVNFTGGNIWMTAGLVTNCIIQNASQSWSTADTANEHAGAGVYMRGGKLVNCIVRGNSVSGTAVKDQASGVYVRGSNDTAPGVVQNCLIVGNNSEVEAAVVFMGQDSRLINCTIVNSTLGTGTELNGGSASIRLSKDTAYVQNCAVAGIVDADGKTLVPLDGYNGTTDCYQRIANSAFDFDLGEVLPAKNNICSTAAEMFASYASGNYKPSLSGPLVDAGKNEVNVALPSVDLAGRPRMHGNFYDIGCYESQGGGLSVRIR